MISEGAFVILTFITIFIAIMYWFIKDRIDSQCADPSKKVVKLQDIVRNLNDMFIPALVLTFFFTLAIYSSVELIAAEGVVSYILTALLMGITTVGVVAVLLGVMYLVWKLADSFKEWKGRHTCIPKIFPQVLRKIGDIDIYVCPMHTDAFEDTHKKDI